MKLLKPIFVLLLLWVCLLPAQAQSTMTDAQITEFITRELNRGTQRSAIISTLIERGVTVDRIQKIRRNYEKQQKKERTNARNISGMENGEPERLRGNSAKKEKKTDFTPRAKNLTQDEDLTDYQRQQRQTQRQQELDEALDFMLPDSLLQANATSSKRIFGHDIFNNKKLTFESDLNIAMPSDYRLGAGDAVFIDVWGASQKQYNATIAPDGTIHLEGYGPVAVGGMTLAQANAQLRATLGARYANSNVRLTVGDMKSITVNVMGEVKHPGTYTLSSLASVFHALYQAGGPNSIGTLRNIKIFRNNRLLSTVDVYDYILNGRLSSNIRLATNDVIVVGPYESLVNITGKVKRPMFYEMRSHESVASLIKYAGGFTGDAYEETLRLIRKKGGVMSVHSISEFERSSFKLYDADSIHVDEALDRYTNMVEVKGAVRRPGMFQMDGGIATVTQLIAAAGGLDEEAMSTRGIIHRRNADRTMTVQNFNVAALLNHSEADIALHNEDIVFIPSRKDLNEELTLAIYGEVQNPGIYNFADNTTIEDFILQAGGLTDRASVAKVDVSRRIRNKTALTAGQQTAEFFTFSIKENFVIDGEAGFTLQPFDEVYVRSSPSYTEQQHVTVEGEVAFTGQYAITKKNTRLSDIIRQAGGVTQEAYLQGARLERHLSTAERIKTAQLIRIATTSADSTDLRKINVDEQQFVGINLDKALANPGDDRYDVIVRDGDRIIIPQYNNTVSISGEVMYPNTVSFKPNAPLSYYVNQCGGFSLRAKKSRAFVVQMNGTTSRLKSTTDIKPGSTIVVPARAKRNGITTAQTISLTATLVTLAAVVVSAFK